MKTKTIFIATDGRRFDDSEECQKYEADGCVFFEPLPKYGTHVPITKEALSWMCDGDGDCYYATATKLSRESASRGETHPEWATHLMYFGK